MTNRYSIKSKIGQGGLGAVYKAYDNNLGRDVALKRVLPAEGEDPAEMAKNLIKEAKTLSALQHPHIVTVYDVGEDTEGPYVVMELLKGETLDATIKRGALPTEDFEQVVIHSLEALVAAQSLGITHRDLKPANIMVIWLPSGKFQIKILDFGLAKFSSTPSPQTIDQSDSILGSIYFMAPEQFERAPLDARTDLYSLGAIYYFTLTGQYPFQGDNAPQVMAAHLQNRFTPLAKLRPDLPAYIPNWVEWLMSRSPDDRPGDATLALNKFLQKDPGSAPAAVPTAQPARSSTGTTSSRLLRPTATGSTSTPLTSSGSAPLAASTSTRLTPSKQQSGKLVASVTPTALPVAPDLAQAVAEAEVQLAEEEPASVVPIDESQIHRAKGPSFFNRIPKWALITLPLLICAVGGYAYYLIAEAKAAGVRNERFQELTAPGERPGTAADVKLLAGFLDDPDGEIGVVAASALTRLQGDEIDPTMLSLLSKFERKPLVNLITAIGERRNRDSFNAIMGYTKSKNGEVRKESFNTLGVVGTPSDIPDLIQALDAIVDESDRDIAENAIYNIASTNPDIKGRATSIASSLNAVKKETKVSLINVLGQIGGDSALRAITEAMKSSDPLIRKAAVKTLELSPSGVLLPTLVDLAKSESDIAVKTLAFRSISQLSQRPGPLPESKVQSLLADLLGATTDKKLLGIVRNSMATLSDDAALAYFKAGESDPDLQAFAKMAIENIGKMKKEVVALGSGGSLTAANAAYRPDGSVLLNGVLREWSGIGNPMVWRFSIDKAGTYRIGVEQSSNSDSRGSYSVVIGAEIYSKKVEKTGTDFKVVNVGDVEFKEPGVYKVEMKPITVDENDQLMRFKEFTLTPK